MYEKVNPSHPDKVADRIAGSIVDLAYKLNPNPKIAVEVLIGHGECNIIIESDTVVDYDDCKKAVDRIADAEVETYINFVPQDPHLANNQSDQIRCGDNGIFKGMPTTVEQDELAEIAKNIYDQYETDGKYIYDQMTGALIICQSYADRWLYGEYLDATINPLGEWTGGINVDTGATNRKLGSDMGDAVTGGGLHGKDLSKADVSVNIYAHLKAQATGKPVELFCAIGDKYVDDRPYKEIVRIAKEYVDELGGFEKLAEWGLIR